MLVDVTTASINDVAGSGGMLFMYSLLEIRTPPNELLVIY